MSTKEKIIDVLADLIKRNENIHDISIAKIAELADIGKSTVYEHFVSKDELIVETYQHLSQYYCSKVLAPIESKTFEQAYKELILRILKTSQEANDIMMGMFNEGQIMRMLPKKEMQKLMEHAQKEIEILYLDVFNKGVQEGIIHPDPNKAKEVGHVIKALTIGLTMQRINDHVDLTEQEAVDYIYRYTILVLNA